MDDATRQLLEGVRHEILVLTTYLQDHPGIPFKTNMTNLSNTINNHVAKYDNTTTTVEGK